jgi:predicted ATPase
MARSFDALFHELRAATSLARLWMVQGRRAEAEALLRPLIASFTEGLELRDLRHAQAVLAQ